MCLILLQQGMTCFYTFFLFFAMLENFKYTCVLEFLNNSYTLHDWSFKFRNIEGPRLTRFLGLGKTRVTWNSCTQGLIKTLWSMVIFDEKQAVSDINKYELLYPIYAKIINFLVIWHHFEYFHVNEWPENPFKSMKKQFANMPISPFLELRSSIHLYFSKTNCF